MKPAPKRGSKETALWLIRHGLRPVPTYPDEKKRPIGPGWGLRSPSRAQVVETFEAHPGAGVGLALGALPGVIDLEVDDRVRAAPLLDTLALPQTLGWASARGDHRIYRWDRRLCWLTNKSVVYLAGGAIELRIGGEGKQCMSVCPPTVGTDRRRRVWNAVWTLAELPESLLRALERSADPKPARGSRNRTTGNEPDRYAAAALRYEVNAVANAKEGTRNSLLNRAAFSLGTLVGAGALEREAVEADLIAAAVSVGLSEREAAATVASGLAAGICNPRR